MSIFGGERACVKVQAQQHWQPSVKEELPLLKPFHVVRCETYGAETQLIPTLQRRISVRGGHEALIESSRDGLRWSALECVVLPQSKVSLEQARLAQKQFIQKAR